MAGNEGKARITVEARVEQAVRELQRLGIVADQSMGRMSKPFRSSDVLQQRINSFRRELMLAEGMAKEELGRKIINPDQFKALGQQARMRFNEGMIGLLSDLNTNDPKFFDKFIQITRQMSGPINERAIKEGSDKSLQHVNRFLDEANARLKAGHANLRAQFSAGLFDKQEFERQKVLLDQAFNQELLGSMRQNFRNLSTQAIQKLGDSFKIIDPAKIKSAADEGVHVAQRFVNDIRQGFDRTRGNLSEQVAKRIISPEDFDRQLRATKDRMNRGITMMIDDMARRGTLTDESRGILQNALFKISPTRVAKDVDEGLAQAKKALDTFEAQYRQQRAAIRERFGGDGSRENEANLIRQTSAAQAQLNRQIMEQISLQRQAGTLTDTALQKLTSGLKIVNPKTVRQAGDQGLQMAEALLRPIEEQFKTRMSALDFQKAAGQVNSRELARMQVAAANAKNNAIRQILNDLGRPDASGKIRLTEDAFNKLAGSLVNVDTYARHAHTSMHQLRSKIFDFLAVFAAVSFVERSVMNVVQAFNQLRAIGNEVAQEEGVERAFVRSSAALNRTADDLLNISRNATRGVVEDFELMRATNMATSLQAVKSADDLRKLMFAGRTMARVMGIDATRGVNDLTIALARGSTRVLDNIGVVLKVEQAQRIYAQQLGKTIDQLTEKEKREAFAVIGLQKAYERALQFGDAENTAAERTARMNAELANQSRELKTTLIEMDSFQAAVATIMDQLDDEDHGIVRWVTAIINALDHIVVHSYRALTVLNIMDYAANKAARAWLDLQGILQGKGTVDEQAAVFDAQIATLERQVQILRDQGSQGFIDPSLAVEGIDAIRREIAELARQRDELMKPVEFTPVTDAFLDKFAPKRDRFGGWDFTHRAPFGGTDEDTDLEEQAKQQSEYVNRLIALYRDFTEQGRDTRHLVALLTTEFGKAQAKTTELGNATDSVIASYASMQTQLRDALDNVAFNKFESVARASVDQFRQLVDLGQVSDTAYDGVVGTLARLNDLLSRQGSLTEENRAKALRLREDAENALVDAPLRRMDREARNIFSILDQLNDQRLPGADAYEQRLESLREAVLNLEDAQSALLTDDQVAQIRRLVGEINKYFNEVPVQRLNEELRSTISLMAAQADLNMSTLESEKRLFALRQRMNLELMTRSDSDPMRTELLRGIAEIDSVFRRRRDTEDQLNIEILQSRKQVTQSSRLELQKQIEEYQRQGINRIAIEEWVNEQLFQIRRTELADVESISLDVSSAIGDAMSMLGAQVDDLSESLRELFSNLIRTFSNMAVQRGVEQMIDNVARLTAELSEGVGGTSGKAAKSAPSKGASAVASAATSAGAAAVIGSSNLAGVALLAGGFALSLISGILNRDKREQEDAQYRAHLRALRQDRAEQMINLVIVFPDKPMNPRDREWQQTLHDTILAGQESRLIGSIKFENR